MSEFLDELARSLAKPMPRSRALRVFGMAIASAAVPLLRPRAAFATFTPNCHTARCPNPPFTLLCKCHEVAIKGVGGETTMCNRICCNPEMHECYCPPDGAACKKKPCGKPCGGDKCCDDDEFCAHPLTRLCCKKGEKVCGKTYCCAPNEECVEARVPGKISQSFCVKRCPPGQAWCGDGKCCPPKWRCANTATGLCKQCGPNEEVCGKKCCDKRTSECCGNAGCCPKNRSCCVSGKKQTCCPPNTKCAVPILPGDIGIKSGTEAICCPLDRLHENPKLCCPAGQVALRGPGLRVGPGLSPFCCPRSQTCGSGAGLTCCQKSATGAETCCNGKCVDLQFDASNCGACGNVCPSGVCSRGICALP